MVEQRTHKPLVGSSNLPFGTILKNKPLVKAGGFLCQYDSEGISELVPTYGGPARYATGFVAR